MWEYGEIVAVNNSMGNPNIHSRLFVDPKIIKQV